MPKPSFIYFDLGKTLIDFDIDRMCRQMAVAARITPERVREVLFPSGMMIEYETGRLSAQGCYEAFCAATGAIPAFADLYNACNEIFTPIASMEPVVRSLHRAGHRMGILSNTCPGHWEYCFGHYPVLRECFSVYALSYEIGSLKPDAAIYLKAAELAGCRPDEIFYADDIAGHVAGAKVAGLDAVVYTTTEALVEELRRRGVDATKYESS
jgi:FMN phosphatase YigB (HAD superfamily)